MSLTVTATQEEQPIRTASLPSHAFTVDDYETMIRAGILTEDSKVELLEGVVVDKMTKNQPHVVIVMFMQHMLAQLVPNDWFVMMEQPIRTNDTKGRADAVAVSRRCTIRDKWRSSCKSARHTTACWES